MRLITLLLLSCIAVSTQAQILKPIQWSSKESSKTLQVGEEVELIFSAMIEDDWYLYSSDFDPDCGPILTSVEFKTTAAFELVGGLKPIGAKKKHDEIFDCEYTYFTDVAEFRQTIKVLSSGLKIEAIAEYQVCSNIDGKCIAFEEEFVFNQFEITGLETDVKQAEPQNDPIASIETTNPPSTTENTTSSEQLNTSKENIFVEEDSTTEETPMVVAETTPEATNTVELVETEEGSFELKTYTSFFDEDVYTKKQSHLWFMLAAFVAGLAALFTPCVFPMIPMTVSFFTSQGGKSKAVIYGISIIVIYSLIGAIIAPFMGPATANHLATNWIPNVIFFVVFLAFALSFFGAFEITLPSSFVNKVDAESDKGGLIGVFFMAFTLVLVSFSCTGPIVGTILVEAAGGAVLKPILGMFAFSAAFAIPFTIFALFPSLLNSLPKSGGWLNSVKVVLGFIELALAFKFLSIADQAYHWNLLDREINIAIWIVILALLGFYLLGKIKLPHDSDLAHISVFRLMLSIVTFSFVVYLIPGMFGAPLKALAGYLPPMYTHDFDLVSKVRGDQDGLDAKTIAGCASPKYADFLHLPHGLKGFYDYEQAMACATAQNKPLFIDFTGHGCTNCREMEANVWSDPRVLNKLKNDFVVLALYVDDKTELPASDWYVSVYDNKIKKTIGKQNADFQIQRVNNNAQPNYLLIGHDEKGLTQPISYDNVDNFLMFLNDGLANFNQQSQSK